MMCYGCLLLWKLDPARLQAWLYNISNINGLDFSLVEGSSGVREDIKYTLNIYGPEDGYDFVGRKLGDFRAFLQSPLYVRPGIIYQNPQMLFATPYEIEAEGEEIVTWNDVDVTQSS
ncbi:hypothetical protein F5Y10DRAFT_264942 [Nemania abortiva]|nr:hypothetical protein F5Y10DRAFT_264942 [Nemania abortiva]